MEFLRKAGRAVLAADDFAAKAETAALLALALAVIGLSATQMALRIFFEKSVLWLDPMGRHLVLWAGFLGAALAAHGGKHFSLDLAERFAPEGKARLFGAVGRLAAAAACVFLGAASIRFLKDEVAAKSVLFSIGSRQIPAVWLELALPIGFALVFFHSLAGLLKEKK